MSELFKCKLGGFLAGIHLLLALICLLYVNLVDKKSVLPVVVLMVLTFPWGTLSLFVPGPLGIAPDVIHSHDDLIFNVGMAVGALINAFVLYLVGYLLTKAFRYLSSR